MLQNRTQRPVQFEIAEQTEVWQMGAVASSDSARKVADRPEGAGNGSPLWNLPKGTATAFAKCGRLRDRLVLNVASLGTRPHANHSLRL